MLLENLCQIAEKKEAQYLYVGISKSGEKFSKIIRDFLVYGFERIDKEEERIYTNNSNIQIMKIELSQEYDYVDIDLENM